MSLYHFTSVDSLIKILITDSLLINNISAMNDITEKKSIYSGEEFSFMNEFAVVYLQDNSYNLLFDEIDWSSDADIDEYFRKDNLEISEEEVSEKKYDYSLAKDEIKLYLNNETELFKKNIYLCCFNKLKDDETIWDKYELWGHYANKHQGVAIKFNEEKIEQLYKRLIKKLEQKQSGFKENLVVDFNYLQSNFSRYRYNLGILGKQVGEIRYAQNREEFRDTKRKGIISFIQYQTKILEMESDINTSGCSLHEFNEGIDSQLETNIDNILSNRYMMKTNAWKNENEFRIVIYEDFTSLRVHFLEGILESIEEIILGDDILDNDLKLIRGLKKTYLKDIKISYSRVYDKDLLESERGRLKYKIERLNKIKSLR